MKELIYLTGKIDFPFFINEIEYLCRSFDRVHVIAYGEDRSACDRLAEKYGFTYEFLNTVSKRIRSLPELPAWRGRDYVRAELRDLKERNGNSLKALGFIYLYGIFAVTAERAIQNRIREGWEIYLYSYWLSRPAFAAASMNLNRNPNVKRIVSRAHRYDIYEEESRIGYIPFRKFIAENLDTIYFISKNTYQYYLNKNYSLNPVQAKRKLSYLGTREPEQKKEKKNSDKIVIASCSDLVRRKRLDLIIKLVDELSELGHKVRWIHIGDGELEHRVRETAKNTFRSGNVEYEFIGRLPNEDIVNLYLRENVDFFVNMSDSEGVPVAVMEALSAGIPCVARDIGGNADAVIDSYDGILAEGGKADEALLKNIAERIADIYDHSDQYRVMSENAYHHWKTTFSGEVNIKRICEDIITSDEIPALD